jgi:general secretion pathway protein E
VTEPTAQHIPGAAQAALSLAQPEVACRIEAELRNRLGRSGAHSGTGAQDPWELVNRGELSERDLLAAYADATGLDTVDEEAFENAVRFPGVTYEYLCRRGYVPLSWTDSTIKLATFRPYGLGTGAWQWHAMFGIRPEYVLAGRSLIENTLAVLYQRREDGPGALTAGDAPDASERALRDLAEEAPIVRLVNDMFSRAVEMRASDIHVEPSEQNLAIRCRVDGVLRTALTAPLSQYPAVASRLKLLAGMNIAERRRPQDGRMDLPAGGRRIDVRASTVPSMDGESIVLRLLEKDTAQFDLETLGIPADILVQFRRLVQMPHGMLLVVGPTGSGKTTTLYGVMKQLNSETRKIVTIEDPVEYRITGLTQIQVRPQVGVTFAEGLRSIVRQDPDIILVGEIRDRETAEIAIHAALTGHLVFSTLHTNDAAGAVSRLLEMGVEAFLISSCLLGVMSQRLVRLNCGTCGGSGLTEHGRSRCRRCAGTGYRGRTGIFELLNVNERIRRGINGRIDSTELAAMARSLGMQTLYEAGMAKVAAGLTNKAEVARVCQLDRE